MVCRSRAWSRGARMRVRESRTITWCVSDSRTVTWFVRPSHVVFSSSWVYSRGVAGGTAVSSCHFVDTKVCVFAKLQYCHCLTNDYVLIKYAINKEVFAQYSCTLNMLVVLIEYHLYVMHARTHARMRARTGARAHTHINVNKAYTIY